MSVRAALESGRSRGRRWGWPEGEAGSPIGQVDPAVSGCRRRRRCRPTAWRRSGGLGQKVIFLRARHARDSPFTVKSHSVRLIAEIRIDAGSRVASLRRSSLFSRQTYIISQLLSA